MKFVLDTSAYSAFNRGDHRLKKLIRAENEIAIPLIVVGELRAGFALGNQSDVNEGLLRRFLDSPNVITLTLSDKTTMLFADIFLKLRQAGTPIGTNDMWIAAMALEHGQAILTLDKDFAHIRNLKTVKL